jgi:YD repeat-containing protein
VIKTLALRTNLRASWARLVWASWIVVLMSTLAHAQGTSATDGLTPLGLSPGSPAGSYTLSGFDNVNLYNGNLNFRLPLLQIHGRGQTSTGLLLAMNTKGWRVVRVENPPGTVNYYPTANLWDHIEPGYSPAVLQSRSSGQTGNTTDCGTVYITALTRLTLTMADGTEYELRDTMTEGASQLQPSGSCHLGHGASRGSVFTTADGSSVTFTSCDANGNLITIYDPVNGGIQYPSGFLMMRDGTRYRFDYGLVSWIRDRNGNLITFTYTNGRVTKITDSLKREVNITYANFVNTFKDTITYRGFGRALRTIEVNYTTLGNVLRSGFTLQTLHDLFPALNGSSSTYHNPSNTVASVKLPDGRLYQFQYNPWGELARMVLPTGGAIEYDYTQVGSGIIGDASGYQIYRRVLERRTYPNGGSVYEGREVYTDSYPSGNVLGNATNVQVVHYDSNGTTIVAAEKHYFSGDARNIASTASATTGYPAWLEGKEIQTEAWNTTLTAALRRQADTWYQTSVSWYTGDPNNSPANNP